MFKLKGRYSDADRLLANIDERFFFHQSEGREYILKNSTCATTRHYWYPDSSSLRHRHCKPIVQQVQFSTGSKHSAQIARKAFPLRQQDPAFQNTTWIQMITSNTYSTSRVEKGSLLMQARENILARNTSSTWDKYGW